MAKRKRKTAAKKVSVSVSIILAVFLSFFVLRAIDNRLGFGIFDKIEEALSNAVRQENSTGLGDKTAADEDLQIHFIDVGQGDSILIRSDGHNILIDAGENDKGQAVVSYLESQGVKTLDLVIGTHPHSDHIGGLDVVINEMDVKQVLMPSLKKSVVPTTKTYRDLLTSIQNKNLTATTSKPGQTYTFGKGVLTVLGPVEDYDDLNDTSLVARFDYGEHSFLFTGDMEKGAEQDLLASGADVSAEVLKLGHHGSSTSSSKAFYEAVAPSYCIASCGEDNEYGHPHKETLQRVQQSGAELYRTDYQGSIVFTIQNGKLAISTQKG